ncbi:unnamed protein product [Eruca vesicaria subsp. sativa]|uniref:RNase H type-1 domain-containing protein n=1 Tax=Eruca vesicaria subsp. sativa TaxID=29727 RepID=A0ABC8KWY0_ERUVS|nr:unnamed protein product [Eruca vesicaria subsp. sativa]
MAETFDINRQPNFKICPIIDPYVGVVSCNDLYFDFGLLCGLFIDDGSSCPLKPLGMESLVAEGLAIRSATKHAITLQFDRVLFESDSLQLISAINGGPNFSDFHEIVSDIKIMSLFFAFAFVAFKFCNRNALCFEDGLAKHALSGFVPNLV